jgi:predicted nucleotidyltransferase
MSQRKTIKEITETLKKKEVSLRDQFKTRAIGILGSYVRGKEKKTSDPDVLVEFQKPISLFEFGDLEDYLRRILGAKVDLVSKKALKTRIGRRILV